MLLLLAPVLFGNMCSYNCQQQTSGPVFLRLLTEFPEVAGSKLVFLIQVMLQNPSNINLFSEMFTASNYQRG
jgi:hypothetical protein